MTTGLLSSTMNNRKNPVKLMGTYSSKLKNSTVNTCSSFGTQEKNELKGEYNTRNNFNNKNVFKKNVNWKLKNTKEINIESSINFPQLSKTTTNDFTKKQFNNTSRPLSLMKGNSLKLKNTKEINIDNSMNLRQLSKTANNFRKNQLNNSNNNRPLSMTKGFHSAKYRPLSASLRIDNAYKFVGNLLPKIPETIKGRMQLYLDIFKNTDFVKHYDNAPSKISKDIDEITDYLISYNSGHYYKELIHYAMFFYYLCNKVTYDVDGLNKNKTDLRMILATGKANSNQFCQLFEYMCRRAQLRVKHIDGNCKEITLNIDKKKAKHLKIENELEMKTKKDIIDVKDLKDLKQSKELKDYLINTTIKEKEKGNHCWNAIMIKNEWYLVDLTFGSGGVKPKGDFAKIFFNPYYFLTLPEFLIETHLPLDELWQLTQKTISEKEFNKKRYLNFGEFYHNVYLEEVKLITDDYPIIYTTDKNKTIKIGLENHGIIVNLFQSNFKTKIKEPPYTFADNIFTIEPKFPRNGIFYLNIESRNLKTSNLKYETLINYRVKVDDRQILKQELMKLRDEKIKQLEALNKNNTSLKIKRPKSAMPLHKIIFNYNIPDKKKPRKPLRDDEGVKILEPQSKRIFTEQTTKVKVKVKEANAIAVLYGQQWNYLRRKKEDGIWEGNVCIESLIDGDFATICALKNCNVYTEIGVLEVVQSHNFFKLNHNNEYKY